MVIVDTGEKGEFAKGEFETITAMNQMEFITPEEIASKVVLEIQGFTTGANVLSAFAGALPRSLIPVRRRGRTDACMATRTSCHAVFGTGS